MKEYSRQEIRQLLRFWIDGEVEIEPDRLRYFVGKLLEEEPGQERERASQASSSESTASEGSGGQRVGFDDLVDQLSNPEILQKVVIRGFKRAWGPSSWNDSSRN